MWGAYHNPPHRKADKMKVSKQEGIDLFKALKYNATDAWTDARLEVKLNALPKMVDDSKRQQVRQVSKQLSKLLSEIVTAVGAGDKVSVTTKETVMAKGKNNGKRPSKPIDDEEEDDEEEVDLDEEEDDTEEEDEDDDNDDDDAESEDDDDGDDEDAEAESEDEEEDDEDDADDEEEAEEDAEDDESDESEDGDDEDDSDDVDEDDEEEDDEEEAAEIVAGSIVNHSKYGQCEVLKIKGVGATLKRANKKLVTNVPLDELELVESDPETDDEEEEEMATATAKKPAAKSKTPPAKGEKKTPFAGAGGEGKPGVIGTIVELLKAASKAAPISKSQMLVALKKRFKDRDEESMKMTINAQVPNRIKKEKQLNVVREGAGYYIAKGAPKMEEAKPAKAKPEATKAPAAPAAKKPAAKTPAPAAKKPAKK